MNNDKYRLVKQISEVHNTHIASEIRDKQKKHYRFDPLLIEEGYEFAKSGFSLDDADERKKNDVSFVYGYQKYIRELYADGYGFAASGFAIDDIEDTKKKDDFVRGYNDYMEEFTEKIDDPYFNGTMAFLCGMNWELISKEDRENEAFVQGFEDAMTMSTKRHR